MVQSATIEKNIEDMDWWQYFTRYMFTSNSDVLMFFSNMYCIGLNDCIIVHRVTRYNNMEAAIEESPGKVV